MKRFPLNSFLSVGCTIILTGSCLQAAQLTGKTSEAQTVPVETKESETALIPLANQVFKDRALERRAITEIFAKDFGMPTGTDDLWMYTLEVKDGENIKTIFIRPRASGKVDIFFIVEVPKKKDFSYYYTSANGKLTRSTHYRGKLEVVPNEKAQKGFEVEMAYWKRWMESTKADDEPK